MSYASTIEFEGFYRLSALANAGLYDYDSMVKLKQKNLEEELEKNNLPRSMNSYQVQNHDAQPYIKAVVDSYHRTVNDILGTIGIQQNLFYEVDTLEELIKEHRPRPEPSVGGISAGEWYK